VQDIKESQEELILATNGGKLSTKMTATVPGYPIRVWYHPKAITNIFAFHEMEKLYRITYDSKKEKAFIVHLEEGRKIRFRQAPNGLYNHKPKELNTQKNIEIGTNMMNTVEENKRFFTNRQIARAYKARELYHALGTPSIHDFKATIIMNAIKNNPVTLEDVKISERIFGPDIGRIKGKTTRIKPNPVVSDYIEIPQELIEKQQDITLCIDTMFINGIAFFTSISRNIMFRTAEPINNQGKEEYVRVMKNVLQIYKNTGFKVTRIHADNEFKLIAKEFNTSYDSRLKRE
jgi:hypothetical protein